jgi:hypothetical protein
LAILSLRIQQHEQQARDVSRKTPRFKILAEVRLSKCERFFERSKFPALEADS